MFALPVFSKLTIAYLDRIAAGDAVRAGIIAQKMSAVWPDMRQAYAHEVQAQGGVPAGTSWPSSIPASWSGDTQTVGVVSIQRQTSQSSPLYQAAAGLYDVPNSSLAAAARAVLAQMPSDAQGRSYVRSASSATPSSLPQILDALISGTVAEDTLIPMGTSSATTTPAPTPPPRQAAPPASVVLPDMHITASSPVPRSITWPWYALGGALAIGIGVYAYQRIQRGKS